MHLPVLRALARPTILLVIVAALAACGGEDLAPAERPAYPLASGATSVFAATDSAGVPLADPVLERELGIEFGQGLSADPTVRDSVLRIRFRAERGELPPDSATRLAIRYLRAWRKRHPLKAARLDTAHVRLVDSLRRLEGEQLSAERRRGTTEPGKVAAAPTRTP